ncbi:unnamed protein product [Rotaria magnacalcarata]|uniref:Uncharacterized protein n=1 Tax=Rotaria magnacalcarata TaxID=392030 RepID=A0A819BE31_9BILA|nr:unnamed protein product [Rotaria magnacalcarata]
MSDPNLWSLLQWNFRVVGPKSFPIYKLVKSNKTLNQVTDVSFLENIRKIPYEEKEAIRKKYLNFLTEEHGYVSIFGYSKSNISLLLESVYVELKFDRTHPSIKAMKILEVSEEFKREILSYGFFNDNETRKIFRAIVKMDAYHGQNIYQDFMSKQWLNIFLSGISNKSNIQEAKQYHVQQAYNEFSYFILSDHPGSGKTTLSKWLVLYIGLRTIY